MTPFEGPVERSYPRSVENLALALVTMEALLTPQAKAEANLHRTSHDNKWREEVDEDPLAPAMGILNGLRLSVAMWGMIALIVLLIW